MKKRIRLTALLLLLALTLLSLSSCSGTPYDYELDEYVRVGDYTQIKVDEAKITAQAEKYKTELILSYSTKSEEQIFGRPLRNGDIAIVTYKCYTEDALLMPIAEATPPEPVLEGVNCEIILGNGKYLPAFESGILNAGVSSREHEWHMTLPTDFGITKLAGKNVVFFVTVSGAYEIIKPQFDNVFVSEHTEFSTVEEYEKAMLEQARFQVIWDELVAQSEVIAYPQNELNEHTLDFIEYYDTQASAASLTIEQYVEKNFFIDINSFHLRADEYSKQYTKEEMLVHSIARKNGLELTDDEYHSEATKYAQKYGYDSLPNFESVYGKSFIQYSVLKDSVMRYVAYSSLSSPELLTPPESEDSTEDASNGTQTP